MHIIMKSARELPFRSVGRLPINPYVPFVRYHYVASQRSKTVINRPNAGFRQSEDSFPPTALG